MTWPVEELRAIDEARRRTRRRRAMVLAITLPLPAYFLAVCGDVARSIPATALGVTGLATAAIAVVVVVRSRPPRSRTDDDRGSTSPP